MLNVEFGRRADVFAFGMVAVEVFTGLVPFGSMTNKLAMCKIAWGHRPEKPTDTGKIGLTDGVWKFLCQCWEQNPESRPKIGEVVRELEGLFAQMCEEEKLGKCTIPRLFQFQVFTNRSSSRVDQFYNSTHGR